MIALALALRLAAASYALDPYEIQVYETDMNKPGHFGMEVHANVAAGAAQVEDGSLKEEHLTRVTLEPSYGVTPWWELGAYLQTAYTDQTRAHWAGYKLRSKFVPAPEQKPFFYGANLEFGHVPRKVEPERYSTEVRPIVGWEGARWFFDINPILDWTLTGSGRGMPEFEPCAKLRFDTLKGYGIGLEHYAALGDFDRVPRAWRQQHLLFAVVDLIDAPFELNFGVGRGLTPATNDWTIKMILGKGF